LATSDHLVDVLGEMDEDASQAILAKMDKEDAEEARMLLEYAPDCAGGLMISEFLAYGLLGGVAFFWKGNPWLGVVVGGALAANTLASVALGGMLPLVLKRLKLDPALVSSPLLTTVTDMCGFFFVLSFAAAVLPKLGGM